MKEKRVLFYTYSPRMFRSTLIGHLFSICQEWPVVLVSEKMDLETENLLKNRSFFPKLEKIVPISQLTGEIKKNIFSQNRYLCNLARDVIEKEKPNIVISASDMHSMFDMYVMRFAKEIGAISICFQPTVGADGKVIEKWIDYLNVYSRFPASLPLWLRFFLTKCRKHLGHLFYHWILPLTVGELPFFGKSSYILYRGESGMRGADYQIVFSKRDFEIYRADGVPAQKLKILPHPLVIKKTRDFFKEAYFNKFKKIKKYRNQTIVLLMPPATDGFIRGNWAVVSKEEREKKWFEIITLISRTIPGWDIIIKPHPNVSNVAKMRKTVKEISKRINIVDPNDSLDKYLEVADAIVGLPWSSSTAIFTALLQRPETPTASLNFFHEVMGDFYKDFEGVEYIEDERSFTGFLNLVRDGKYKNNNKNNIISNFETIDLIKELIKK